MQNVANGLVFAGGDQHRDFLELVTLGAGGARALDASMIDAEVWELYGNEDAPADEDSVQAMVDRLGLE